MLAARGPGVSRLVVFFAIADRSFVIMVSSLCFGSSVLNDDLLPRLCLSVGDLEPEVVIVLLLSILGDLCWRLQDRVPYLHLLAVVVVGVADISQVEFDLILPLHDVVLQILRAIRRLIVIVPVLVQVQILEAVAVAFFVESALDLEVVAAVRQVHTAVVRLLGYRILDGVIDHSLVDLVASLFLQYLPFVAVPAAAT